MTEGEEEEKSEFPEALPEELPKELQEMIDKLPMKFGEPNANANPQHITLNIINDKDFSYKFLYCVDLNQKKDINSRIKQIMKDDITNYYYENKSNSDNYSNNIKYTATFEEGFFVNTYNITKEGGSTSTQKRKPKRQRKSNNTIRMRTR